QQQQSSNRKTCAFHIPLHFDNCSIANHRAVCKSSFSYLPHRWQPEPGHRTAMKPCSLPDESMNLPTIRPASLIPSATVDFAPGTSIERNSPFAHRKPWHWVEHTTSKGTLLSSHLPTTSFVSLIPRAAVAAAPGKSREIKTPGFGLRNPWTVDASE